MKKIKTIIKNNILGFIVSAILFGGIGVVYAVTLIDSGKVSFSNDNMKSTNVQDAIDELNTTCTLAMKNNSASNKLKKTVVTEGDGLYADSTETGRYVYKGANPNNYITLGSDTYRIISVESDGTLKVIRNGSLGEIAFDTAKARYSTTSTDYCNSTYGCKVWGSKTTTLDASGNNVTQMPREVGGTLYNLPDTEASLNTYLNNDWYNSLDSSVQNLVVSHMFNVGAPKYNETSLSNTITQEQTYKWNGKVGLMNPSDYVKASTNSACTSLKAYYSGDSSCYSNSATHNWIFAGPAGSSYSWTIAPYSYSRADGVFFVHSRGSLYCISYDAGSSYDVAPVLYLSSDISLGGEGTLASPYTII